MAESGVSSAELVWVVQCTSMVLNRRGCAWYEVSNVRIPEEVGSDCKVPPPPPATRMFNARSSVERVGVRAQVCGVNQVRSVTDGGWLDLAGGCRGRRRWYSASPWWVRAVNMSLTSPFSAEYSRPFLAGNLPLLPGQCQMVGLFKACTLQVRTKDVSGTCLSLVSH